MRRSLLAVTVPAALALAACASAEPAPLGEPGASDSPTSTSPSPVESASPTASTSTTSGPAALTTPTGSPQQAEPTTALLDWQPVDDPTATVTRNDVWSIAVGDDGATVRIEGRKAPRAVEVGRRMRVDDVLLDEEYAVIVAHDELEERPSVATVLDVATGERRTLDGSSSPPVFRGGSWALYDGVLAYPTVSATDGYCLASYDLRADKGRIDFCAPARTGYNRVQLTADGISLVTFDDRRPVACRTAALLVPDEDDLGTTTPLPGPSDCKATDVVLVPGGAVWSEPVKETEIESGIVTASHEGQLFTLGPGTSGTLVRCGDSAYFSSDSQSETGQARLLRWTPDGTLEVVYTSPGQGNAFLSPPRCAGDVITVNAYGEGGDEQVWARIPD